MIPRFFYTTKNSREAHGSPGSSWNKAVSRHGHGVVNDQLPAVIATTCRLWNKYSLNLVTCLVISRLPKDSAQQHLLLELRIQEPFENSIGLNQSSAKATNGRGFEAVEIYPLNSHHFEWNCEQQVYRFKEYHKITPTNKQRITDWLSLFLLIYLKDPGRHQVKLICLIIMHVVEKDALPSLPKNANSWCFGHLSLQSVANLAR